MINKIKPYLPILFGALLFLAYFNMLSDTGAGLALGIIAIIFAAYYLAYGILMLLMKEKLEKYDKLFKMINASLFPLFLFIYYLLVLIEGGSFLDPLGWILAILMMIASLGVACLVVVLFVTKNEKLKGYLQLAAMCLVLLLFITIFFSENGDEIVLGRISVVSIAIKVLYVMILLNDQELKFEMPKL